MIRHFLSLSSFSEIELSTLIDRAQYFYLHQKNPDLSQNILKNKIISNVFYEPSTRTRCSFEIAAKKLGAEVVNFTPENSSVKKGETLYDTLKTMEGLGVDAIVLRHSDDKVFDQLQQKFNIPLINAGAGKYEHPSQGLLDLLTLKQEFGHLRGLKVAVCGDIKHSRVAGSLMVASKIFGMEAYLVGPDAFMPNQAIASTQVGKLDDVLKFIDALMLLRVQLERHESLDLDHKSYHRDFGLNLERLKKMKSTAIIMHPGPFNRGIELSDEVVEHPQSRIFKQVNNGVASRMAILEWALAKG